MKIKKNSRKLKHSWRKNIDVSDIDAFLENKRLEERLGKSFEDRSNEELFQIDKIPENLIPKSVSSQSINFDFSSLNCFRSLRNNSAVEDPIIKRNIRHPKKENRHLVLKKEHKTRLLKGILKKQESIQLEKCMKNHLNSFKSRNKCKRIVNKDLWDDTNSKSKEKKLGDWLNDSTLLHIIENTSSLKKSSKYRPTVMPTDVPTFEIPHPGTSYNPKFEDHFELAQEIVNKELDLQKEEAHLNRVTAFKHITEEQNKRNWLHEMCEGLPNSENTKENSEMDQINENSTEFINPPVSRENKKTRKQRKKQLLIKKEEYQKKELEVEKKKSLDLYRINNILKEILNEEIQMDIKTLKKVNKFVDKYKNARRLGKNKFTPNDPDITQVSELCGSLREIIPQGNILKDKLLNMQKRNLVEVTKPQFKNKKKKVKKYVRSSHRERTFEKPAQHKKNKLAIK